jgi:hypothetical protein
MEPRHDTVLRHRAAIACFLGSIVVDVAGLITLESTIALPIFLGLALVLLGLRLEPHRSRSLRHLGLLACIVGVIVAFGTALFLVVAVLVKVEFNQTASAGPAYLFLAAAVVCVGFIAAFVGGTLWRGEDSW